MSATETCPLLDVLDLCHFSPLAQNELLMQDFGKRMETMVYNLGDSHFFYNDLDVSLPPHVSQALA